MSIWLKAQVALTILAGIFLIIALSGVIGITLSQKGILSTDKPFVSFLVMLIMPMSALLFASFIYSSIVIGFSIYMHLFADGIGSFMKKLFIIHAIYEIGYVGFFIFILSLKKAI